MRAALLAVGLLVSSLAQAAPWVATHRATALGDSLMWTSHFGFHRPSDHVALAVPLPADIEVISPHITAERDANGRIVALYAPDARGHWSVQLRQPWEERSPGQLGAPLADTDAVQRIIVDEARLVPAAAPLGLQKHIRYWGPRELDKPTRRRIDQFAGKRTRAREQPVYLVADTRLTEAGGLWGRTTPMRRITPGAPMAIGGVFLGFLGLCAWGYRRLDILARAEKNALYIERELGAAAANEGDGEQGHPPGQR